MSVPIKLVNTSGTGTVTVDFGAPMPEPRDGESESEFVDRCASEIYDETDPDKTDEGRSKQAVAMCESQWRQKHGGSAPADSRARCPRVARAVLGHAWAIIPDKLEAILEVVERRAIDGIALDPDAMGQLEARTPRTSQATGGVAVIPVLGVLSHRMNLLSAFSGGTSTQQLGADIDAAIADRQVGSILLDIDSPGGSVEGVTELAGRIRSARETKPVVAVANATAASAAYWLASQATEVSVTPSGHVGSIGVVGIHEDWSKADEMRGVKTTLISAGPYKTEGSEFEPLSAEAHEMLQSTVNDHYAMFVDDVASGRKVSRSSVRDGFGQGRMVRPRQAFEAGMVDRIETFEQALGRLLGEEREKSERARSATRATHAARKRKLTLAALS